LLIALFGKCKREAFPGLPEDVGSFDRGDTLKAALAEKKNFLTFIVDGHDEHVPDVVKLTDARLKIQQRRGLDQQIWRLHQYLLLKRQYVGMGIREALYLLTRRCSPRGIEINKIKRLLPRLDERFGRAAVVHNVFGAKQLMIVFSNLLQ